MKQFCIGIVVTGGLLASSSCLAEDCGASYDRSHPASDIHYHDFFSNKAPNYLGEVHNNIHPLEAKDCLSATEGMNSMEVSQTIRRYLAAMVGLENNDEKAQFSYLFIEKMSAVTPVTASFFGHAEKRKINIVAWGTTRSQERLSGNHIPIVVWGDTTMDIAEAYRNYILQHRAKASANKKLQALLGKVFTNV